jgi:hypothetical protein
LVGHSHALLFLPFELVKSIAKQRSISHPLSTYCLNRGRVIRGVSSIIGGSRISHGALANDSFKSLATDPANDSLKLYADTGAPFKLVVDLGAPTVLPVELALETALGTPTLKLSPNKLLVGGSGSLGSTSSALITRIVPTSFPSLLSLVRIKSFSLISSIPSSSPRHAFINLSTVVSHTPNSVSACPFLIKPN